MAPEFPPRLVVITLEMVGDSIAAQIENVEPKIRKGKPTTAEPLRVRWSELERPSGYRPVGSGALFVEDSARVFFDGPRPINLDQLKSDRFRWVQGTPPGIPWVMIAVVFPPGYSLRRPRPAPTSAKNFDGRVAVYWCPEGDAHGRALVQWDLHPLGRPVDEEVRSLNSQSSLDEVPLAAGIDIDSAITKNAPPRINVFLCHASQDKPRVRSLYAQLKEDGFVPWLDEEDILPGEAWEPAIRNAVRSSHVVLVCVSRQSISKVGFLQKELRFVLEVAEEQPEGAIFIIPLRLDDAELPDRLSKWQRLDYFEDGAHGRLLRALRKRASQLQPA